MNVSGGESDRRCLGFCGVLGQLHSAHGHGGQHLCRVLLYGEQRGGQYDLVCEEHDCELVGCDHGSFQFGDTVYSFRCCSIQRSEYVESSGDPGDRGLHVVYVGNLGQFFAGGFGQPECCGDEQLGFCRLRSGTNYTNEATSPGSAPTLALEDRINAPAGSQTASVGGVNGGTEIVVISVASFRVGQGATAPAAPTNLVATAGNAQVATELERIGRSDQL